MRDLDMVAVCWSVYVREKRGSVEESETEFVEMRMICWTGGLLVVTGVPAFIQS